MKRMCPAEEQEAPAEPPEAGNGQLASGGASGLVEWAYVSDPGSGRDSNEDYAGADVPEDPDAVPLFVVADGMGGHAAGEVASRLAVETVLTADQPRVGEMLRMRLITAEQAARHPARSLLTRSLGSDPILQIDLTRQPAELRDTYVLCSDGLWDVVARGEIAAIAAGEPGGDEDASRPPSEAAAALIELALKRDAPDNITVAVIRLLAEGSPQGRRPFWRRGA